MSILDVACNVEALSIREAIHSDSIAATTEMLLSFPETMRTTWAVTYTLKRPVCFQNYCTVFETLVGKLLLSVLQLPTQ